MVAGPEEVEMEVGEGGERKASAPGMWEGEGGLEVGRYLESGLGRR